MAALSNTESSQSSGTSDITEPCSPPSPVSPRSCLHLQSDGDHLNGYDTTSPPSCQGSYDSGLEEATASQSPPTPGQSSDDHSLGKEESPCHRQEEDELYPDDQNDSYPPCLHKDIVSSELLPSCADSDGFQEGVCCDIATDSLDCCDRFLQPSESTVGHWSTGTVASHEDDVARRGSVKATSWTHSNQQSLWGRRSPVSTSSATVQDQRSVSLNKSKVTPECIETRSVKQLGCLASEGDPLLMCRWTNCYQSLPGGGDMIDHIRNCHVDAQVNAESFVCLWEGCKVYSKASCSLSWLERHVLTHSGNKPFKCIVDGCGQRFTSQNGLERHVNSHFNQPQPHNGNLHKRKDETPSKIMKKKRMRYRRTCWTGKWRDLSVAS